MGLNVPTFGHFYLFLCVSSGLSGAPDEYMAREEWARRGVTSEALAVGETWLNTEAHFDYSLNRT